MKTNKKTHMFTFGEPLPALNQTEMFDYLECWISGKWYEPPISWTGLAKSLKASTHHASSIYLKRNLLASSFIPHPWFSREAFSQLALDFLVFGNAYLEKRCNRLGKIIELQRVPAKYVRRGIDLDTYYFVRGWQQEHLFKADSIVHFREPDVNQEVYGLPEYLGALHAAWLNESATLFRRKYYENGSHAGFILYMTDAAHQEADVNNLRQALKESKGPGNFRNLFVYAPNGKKDGLQLIPVSEVTAKDEFFNIKNVTRDDLLAAHRVPPQLLGIVPSNAGGFGAADASAKLFTQNEIQPLQARFIELNNKLSEEVISFKDE